MHRSDKPSIVVFWHRRDLRVEDNHGLFRALEDGHPVLPIFIFDTHILRDLPVDDARVEFIHTVLDELKAEYKEYGSDLCALYNEPLKAFIQLSQDYEIKAIYTNRDYEPYAKERDKMVREWANARSIPFMEFKDHVIFDQQEVVKDDGSPYTVFTPYKKKWLEAMERSMEDVSGEPTGLLPFNSSSRTDNLWQGTCPWKLPSLQSMGFEQSGCNFPAKSIPQQVIRDYDKFRDFPAMDATSRLGIHFRFGTISIREKARKAYRLNKTFLSELIWRDFYSTILDHFPRVVDHSFRPEYDRIQWRNDPEEFQKWCDGNTGFPLVDAGMRELNQTGYMHNRVRMVVASFLTKHLLIDWRWGEAYFARKLLDFDLASNNGGWQWAAGSGTDAAPYFRIFNPASQAEKFDKENVYIRKWVPEYGTPEYPAPIVDHRFARERCLRVYKEALTK